MVRSNRKPPQTHDKDPKASFSTVLLTSGVLIALVTGAFNFFNNRENNVKLLELERQKQALQINADRSKRLYDAHLKLIEVQLQPLYTAADLRNAVVGESIDVASLMAASTQRIENVRTEFMKIRPLLDDPFQKRIDDLVEKEDRLESEAFSLARTRDAPTPTTTAKLLELVSLRQEMEQTVIEVIAKQMLALRQL